jgi:hypothetical protein
MPMDGDVLGAAMAAAIQTVIDNIASNPPGTPMSEAQKVELNSVAGGAIIDHIKNNAVVTVNVIGGSSSGAHTGTIS